MYVHIHDYKHRGVLFSHKKEEILPFVTTWMNLEDIMLSEISQTEKDKHCMISLVMRELKNRTKQKSRSHGNREERGQPGAGVQGTLSSIGQSLQHILSVPG